MDNVGIVVESLDAAISFFAELGLELEGRAMIEGDWSGRVTGLRDQRVDTAMMRMPDGHGRIELSRFLTPPPVADHRNAPVNALGYLRVMFAVDDLDDTLARLREHGAQLVDEVVEYKDVYRLCYVRGPEGISSGWPNKSADAQARSGIVTERCGSRPSSHQGAIVAPPHSSGATSRNCLLQFPAVAAYILDDAGALTVFPRRQLIHDPCAGLARPIECRIHVRYTHLDDVRHAAAALARMLLAPASATTTAPSEPTRNWARCPSPIRTRSPNANADSSHATAARTSS